MTRKELIEALLAIGNDDTEVLITDGFRCLCYRGDYVIDEFEGQIDIGIGGTEEIA